MKVFYWIMICLTYLQGVAFAVWSIGYVIYYFVKLRKEYEEFDVGIYICTNRTFMGNRDFITPCRAPLNNSLLIDCVATESGAIFMLKIRRGNMKKEILSLLSMILMIYFGVAFANTYETKYLIPAMVFFISTVGIIIADTIRDYKEAREDDEV